MGPLGHAIYGIDIETDVSFGSIDPSEAPIRAIGCSTRDAEVTFTGEETSILRRIDDHLADLPPGVIATWNGATFDLPYIADRARMLGVGMRLVLYADRRRRTTRALLPGHDGPYRASWGEHRHLDTFRLYGDSTTAGGISALLGLRRHRAATIASTDDLLNEAIHAHAASDARLARVLTERRGTGAFRHVDHVSCDEAALRIDGIGPLAPTPVGDRTDRVVLRPAVVGLG